MIDLHSKGLYYGDLKPANVLFDNLMNVFVSDMGTCLILDNNDKTKEYQVTGLTQGMGKPDLEWKIYQGYKLTRLELI
jgi:serine/threonine protein kinase